MGGNWSGDFGGASVSVGAGYASASAEMAGAEDHEEWIIGARASMDAISVGGNYSVDNNGMAGNNERSTIAVGATHSGLLAGTTVGITYALTTREQGMGNADLDSSGVSLGATWGLGGGLSVSGEVQFWDIELDSGANEATAAMIGTTVRF